MINYIFLHHSGSIGNSSNVSSKHLTWQDINEAHKARWNFQSTLGEYGGYTFFINQYGELHQFRAVGEETASQKGYNQNSVSVCLAGNFLTENPTKEQLSTLRNLLITIVEGKYSRMNLKVLDGVKTAIPLSNILPHFAVADTECNALPKNWGQEIVLNYYRETISTIQLLLQELIKKLRAKLAGNPVGGVDRDCVCSL